MLAQEIYKEFELCYWQSMKITKTGFMYINEKFISWDELDKLVDELCDMIPDNQYEGYLCNTMTWFDYGVMMSHKLDYL